MSSKSFFAKYDLLLYGLTALVALVLVYANHFENEFHFDDSHSVVNNVYIRDLGNIPKFFKDATTISSLPANQSYRPLMPVSYAIDYKIGGGMQSTFYFHLSTFIWYLLQCVLMFFFIQRIMNMAGKHALNRYLALLAVCYYAFHTSNAETINYISARSDSTSTFWIIASLSFYIFFPSLRKWQLYLLILIPGILIKPSALVMPGLLFMYILIFEELREKEKISSSGLLIPIWNALWKSLPAMIVCAAFYVLQREMTPATFVPGSTSLFHYLITQPFVSLYYFKTFFLPTHLSADTDWKALTTMLDVKFFVGMVFILAMILAAYFTMLEKKWRPVSFGIIWFFIALLPSSSIIPFAEVMNDHRIFFPYVGLVISLWWLVSMVLSRFEKEIATQNVLKNSLLISALLVFSIHAYGVYERNKVWKTDESLWYDVTLKSPENGRGLMNYGLSQMKIGNYPVAEDYFTRALKIWPNYSYLHVNMGVLKNATGNSAEAENYFKRAVELTQTNPEVFYYYGDFLNRHNRKDEAEAMLKRTLEVSPAHVTARNKLMQIYLEKERWDELESMAKSTLSFLPGDAAALDFLSASEKRISLLEMESEKAEKDPTPQKYLNLSLKYYQASKYEECIAAARKALILKPGYPEAYNNICSAFNQLGNFAEARKACEEALTLKPDFQLAKNNLAMVLMRMNEIETDKSKAKNNPSPENFLNLSLTFYNQKKFRECIEAASMALKLKPDYAEAYNNICSAYNQLGEYANAVEACKKALAIRSDFQLAKNNLNWAEKQISAKKNR